MSKYTLRTLFDIVLNVPEEKIDYFLTDLKGWVLFHKEARKSGILKPKSQDMTWIDDGKHNAQVKVNIKGGHNNE